MTKPMTPNPVEHRLDGTTILTLYYKGEKHFCCIDTANYPLVKDYRWRAIPDSLTFHARAHQRNVGGGRRTIFMHRILLADCETVDHRDHNGLNNRRENLRPADRGQQQANKTKPKHVPTTSKFKGVWKSRGKFLACIGVNSKTRHLGTFATEIEAALAYNEAAKKYFGEFAHLNVIPDLAQERAA